MQEGLCIQGFVSKALAEGLGEEEASPPAAATLCSSFANWLVNVEGDETPLPLPLGMGWNGLQTFLVREMLLRQGGDVGQVDVVPSMQWGCAGGT